MSGHLDCPACEVRTIEDEDGIMYGRKVRCTGAAGCRRTAAAIEDMLTDFHTRVSRQEAEQEAARIREAALRATRRCITYGAITEQAAARACEARIQATRDAVLEACRQEIEAEDAYDAQDRMAGPELTAYCRAAKARDAAVRAWLAAEAEGGER